MLYARLEYTVFSPYRQESIPTSELIHFAPILKASRFPKMPLISNEQRALDDPKQGARLRSHLSLERKMHTGSLADLALLRSLQEARSLHSRPAQESALHETAPLHGAQASQILQER